MTVIVVVGMPGSGKDIFVQAAKERGFAQVKMGDVVRHFASERAIGTDDTSVGGFADGERERHGKDVWALRTLEGLPEGNVVIDGSRSLFEIKCFRQRLDSRLYVVGIDAPEQRRFERLRARGREDDPVTYEEFKTRDGREISWGIGEAMKAADLVMVNDGGLEGFRRDCLAALDELA